MFKPFDIVRAVFPFVDLPVTKRRPALIISTSEYSSVSGLYICCMITTKRNRRFQLDFEVEEYKERGLPRPCLVRVEKLFSLERKDILEKVGELSSDDKKKIYEKLGLLLSLKSEKEFVFHEKPKSRYIKPKIRRGK